jgi:hypothetical protein
LSYLIDYGVVLLSSMDGRGDGGAGSQGGFTFDTNLASMHTYLGGMLMLPVSSWFDGCASSVYTCLTVFMRLGVDGDGKVWVLLLGHVSAR